MQSFDMESSFFMPSLDMASSVFMPPGRNRGSIPYGAPPFSICPRHNLRVPQADLCRRRCSGKYHRMTCRRLSESPRAQLRMISQPKEIAVMGLAPA
jgi:hypothetical protein